MSRPFHPVSGTVTYHVPSEDAVIVVRTTMYQANLLNRRTGAVRRIYNTTFQPHVEHLLAFMTWRRRVEQARG
jgi:hypothetical protein